MKTTVYGGSVFTWRITFQNTTNQTPKYTFICNFIRKPNVKSFSKPSQFLPHFNKQYLLKKLILEKYSSQSLQ